jgi:hypothetical protein
METQDINIDEIKHQIGENLGDDDFSLYTTEGSAKEHVSSSGYQLSPGYEELQGEERDPLECGEASWETEKATGSCRRIYTLVDNNVDVSSGNVVDLESTESMENTFERSSVDESSMSPSIERYDKAEHSKKLQCPRCSYTTMCKDEMRRHQADPSVKAHIRFVHGVKREKCPHCNYTTSTQSRLNLHVKTLHDDIQVGQDIVTAKNNSSAVSKEEHKCNQCDFVSLSEYHLEVHYAETVHDAKVTNDQVVKFKCLPCNFTSFSEYELEVHNAETVHETKVKKGKYEQSVHNQENEESGHSVEGRDQKEMENVPEKNNKTCPHCTWAAPTPYQLRRHLNSVHFKIKDNKCKFCEFRSARKDSVAIHVRRVHVKNGEIDVSNWIKCEHCDFLAPTIVIRNIHAGLAHGKK